MLERVWLGWLRGQGLRELAGATGVHHTTLYQQLKKEYGPECCSHQAMSLPRSLASDYGSLISDQDLLRMAKACLAKPDGLRHRSLHSIRQLSKYQTVHKPEQLELLVEQQGLATA